MNQNEFFLPSSKYNLSKLPDSIISILINKKSENILPYSHFKNSYDKIILFLIDGLGVRHLQKFKKSNNFLKTIEGIGLFSTLTCQFPSSTAANVTTIHTGLNVAHHGICEWFYFEPLVDDIIAPVLFSYARDDERETLQNKVNPQDIYPSLTIYQKLSEYGVKSFVFQNNEYIDSTYSKALLKSAEIKGYNLLSEGLGTLAELINKNNEKSYYLFYYDMIDKISHEYGPDSEEFKEEMEILFGRLEKFSLMLDKNVLFILTSDHGQISLDPHKNIYLNNEFPEIEKYIKKSGDGNLLVPAGSPRDMFLYIKDEMLDEAQKILQEKLYKKALVYKTSYLLENNYLGNRNVSNALINRLGNLIILPLENWTIWWYEKDIFEFENLGHHGGLSKDEMEIPLLIWSYRY